MAPNQEVGKDCNFYLVVKVESTQISSFCCSSISVGESSLFKKKAKKEKMIYKPTDRSLLPF